MAIDDLAKKAEGLAQQAGELAKNNADKVNAALKSEQAEDISDKVLDGVAGFANTVTGGKFADQVQNARDTIDKNIGTE